MIRNRLLLQLKEGALTFSPQQVRAGEIDKAKAIARQSTWISAIFGLAFGIVTLF
jgi:Na+-driven multidrug efflux pump